MKRLLLLLLTANLVAGEINIGWKPVKNAKEYSVTYGTDNLTTTLITGRTNLSIPVVAGKSYFVTVKAVNGTNESDVSKPIFISLPKPQARTLEMPRPFIIAVPNKYGHAE